MPASQRLALLVLAAALAVSAAPYSLSPGRPPYVGILPARRRDLLAPLTHGNDPSSPKHVAGIGLKRQADPAFPHTVQLVNIAPSALAFPVPSHPGHLGPVTVSLSPSEHFSATSTAAHHPAPTHLDSASGALSSSSQPTDSLPSYGAPAPTDTLMAPGSKGSFFEPPLTPHDKVKVAVIAAVLSIIVGLIACVAIAKLTSNALRKQGRRYAQFGARWPGEESVPKGSAAGAGFVSSDGSMSFVAGKSGLTSPAGSLSSIDSGTLTPPLTSLDLLTAFPSPPPSAVPSFPLPAVPAPHVSPLYTTLLHTPVTQGQQQQQLTLEQFRASFASDTTESTSPSLSRNTTAASEVAVRGGHRRMRSAPVSIAVSAAPSRAPSAALTVVGEEGFWDLESLYPDTRPVSASTSRRSRTRSVEVISVSSRM